MSFPYNTDIPAANNDPSDDQPLMRQNTNSINQLIAVDHITFGNATGGQHAKVTFPDVNAQGAQVDPASVMYTEAGAESLYSQLKFRNQGSAFPLNIVKAYGVYRYTTGSPGTVAAIGSQNFNILSVGVPSQLASTIRTIPFTIDIASAGIPVANNNVGVLVSLSPSLQNRDMSITYTFSNPTLNINIFNTTSGAPVTSDFTFFVLQV